MATRVEAAGLLVEHAARTFDAGGRCDLQAGMAKLFATEAAIETVVLQTQENSCWFAGWNCKAFCGESPGVALTMRFTSSLSLGPCSAT